MPINAKNKRSAVAHRLGLKNNPHEPNFKNEGWYIEESFKSTQSRFYDLTKTKIPYFLLSRKNPAQLAEVVENLSLGGYLGQSTRWEGHAFSLHTIKDKDGTHFIYVNRGQRHIGADTSATVRVFTVKNGEDVGKF